MRLLNSKKLASTSGGCVQLMSRSIIPTPSPPPQASTMNVDPPSDDDQKIARSASSDVGQMQPQSSTQNINANPPSSSVLLPNANINANPPSNSTLLPNSNNNNGIGFANDVVFSDGHGMGSLLNDSQALAASEDVAMGHAKKFMQSLLSMQQTHPEFCRLVMQQMQSVTSSTSRAVPSSISGHTAPPQPAHTVPPAISARTAPPQPVQTLPSTAASSITSNNNLNSNSNGNSDTNNNGDNNAIQNKWYFVCCLINFCKKFMM